MVYRTSSGRRTLVLILLSIIAIGGISLFFKKQTIQVHQARISTAVSEHQVRLKFYTSHQRYLGSFNWSNQHVTAKGADVTDLLANDLIDSDSDVSTHLPHRYKFDQTNLKNVKALRYVKLGSTVKLIVTRVAHANKSPYHQFVEWLQH